MTLPCQPFVEAVEECSGGNAKLRQREYGESGRLAIVDQGQNSVAGYTDDESLRCRVEGPVIVFGDHTRVFKYVDFPFVMGADGVKVLRVRPGWDTKYVFHYLLSRRIPSAGYSRHFKFLKDVTIPRPPIEEQRRIAAILDQADALRAKRHQRLALLDDLTKSIFLHMFGSEARRAVITHAGLTHARGWDWVELTDVSRLATGHTPDRNQSAYWDGSIPWISLPEIRRLDGRTASATDLTITELGVANSSAVVLPASTVCFSRTASIGFVTKLGRPMATSQDFHNWIPGPRLDPAYLMTALRVSRPHLLSTGEGSTHKTVYQRVAERFRVLLPPITLQREFALRASAAWSIRDRIEQRDGEEELIDALQSRAFSGLL